MIKVFEYLESDIDQMRFNHWGRHLKNSKNLRKVKRFLKENHSFTIYDNKPVAILSFYEYDKDKYYGCIIASDCFGDSPKYAIKMKWLIDRCIKEFGAKRVETISEDSPKLNKWHEFLGFEIEKKDVAIEKDVHYSLWSIKWEQQH